VELVSDKYYCGTDNTLLKFFHAEAQRTQRRTEGRTMSSEKASFFFHEYFHYENKKKHLTKAQRHKDTKGHSWLVNQASFPIFLSKKSSWDM
jgi:hypothetical protein